MFVPKAKIDELREVVLTIGEHWLSLREFARRGNHLCWKVAPKTHKFQHLPLYASVLNPRFTQCYAEESLIGTTTAIWKRSMNRRYKKRVQHLVLLKPTLGFFLRLEA